MDKLTVKVQKYMNDIASRISNDLSKKDEFLLLSDIDNLMEIIWFKKLDISIPSIVSKFKNSHYTDKFDDNIDESFLDNFNSMRKTNSNIADLTSILPFKQNFLGKNNYSTLSFEKAISMINDFFEYYDEDVYKHFNNLVDHGNIVLFNSNGEKTFCGANFHLSTQENSIILISDSLNDITLASAIAHETIHSYSNIFLKGISYKQINKIKVNNLIEVYSYFIECVFMKYLKDNNDFDNYSDLKNKLSYNLCDFAHVFNYYFNNFNHQNLHRFNFSEAYFYGILSAIHFFNEYQINPEEAKENILNMFIDSKDYDKHFLLNNYGINECNLGNYKILEKNLFNY